MRKSLDISLDWVEEFCRNWEIVEFSLFGSALREDFRPDSDVDVLISFAPDADCNLYDLVDMRDELEEIFGRKVDLVSKAGIRNPFRRREIINSRKVIYAA